MDGLQRPTDRGSISALTFGAPRAAPSRLRGIGSSPSFCTWERDCDYSTPPILHDPRCTAGPSSGPGHLPFPSQHNVGLRLRGATTPQRNRTARRLERARLLSGFPTRRTLPDRTVIAVGQGPEIRPAADGAIRLRCRPARCGQAGETGGHRCPPPLRIARAIEHRRRLHRHSHATAARR
jgi:hypothetical protein